MKKTLTLFTFIAVSIWSNAQQITPVITNNSSPGLRGETDDKVYIFGSSSTDALKLEDFTTTGGISLGFRPSDRVFAMLTFNYGGKIPSKENADSSLLSSLYFPDIATTAFAASLERRLVKFNDDESSLWLSSDGSLQSRNFFQTQADSTSKNYNLGISNVNIGLKYRWDYNKGDHSASFNIGAFYNAVFLNRDTNNDSFSTLFADYQIPEDGSFQRKIHGLSLLTTMQIDNVIFYARTYTQFGQANDLAFTVGFKLALRAFSF